jgi:sirohydrochlorin ferrochelatase
VRTGIVVFAHGSTVEQANEAIRTVTAEMARKGGYDLTVAAFLDIGKPDLLEAVGLLAAAGASRIVVIPYFLAAGTHLQRDLPRLVRDVAEVHPDVEIVVTEPLDGHPALPAILLDRARAALER